MTKPTRKPRSWSDRLDGATVILHRFDECLEDGVNFLEVRLREDETADSVKQREGDR